MGKVRIPMNLHSFESKFLNLKAVHYVHSTHIRSLLETPLNKQKGRKREDWKKGICLRFKDK